MIDTIALLRQLVAIPSYSREEGAKADYMARFLTENGCTVQRAGNNLWTWAAPYDASKPVLLLNSHLDTVRPNASWTRNPHEAMLENGCVYGLGSNDAHASVVSLTAAFLELKQRPQAYNLVLGLSCEEEVSGKNGVELLLAQLPPVAFAVVGEPTGMQLAVAERGLMVLDGTVWGRSGHAARDEGDNAIYKAMRDVAWFESFRFPKVSEVLGPVKMSVTMIAAGTQHNVVPDKCTYVVDVRLNECYTHAEVLEEVRRQVAGEVVPRSMRLCASGIASDHPFVQVCRKAGIPTFGSSTLSDQALMAFPSVKIGPGQSSRSHTADEFVRVDELEQAAPLYVRLLDGLIF
ncbi:MAG: M20 family metallo-hydrolase [Paludibacteraceae bacterium]|nr:M20 family metallo-hydrolase [Paludibacteraceae bacterium]